MFVLHLFVLTKEALSVIEIIRSHNYEQKPVYGQGNLNWKK